MGRHVSPQEYKKLHPESNLGIEGIKKAVRTGKIRGFVEEGTDKKYAHYHVWIDDDEDKEKAYTNECIESVIRENEELKTKLRMICDVAKI